MRLARQALEIQPKSGQIMDSVGWVYYKQGKLVEAEQQFRAASDMLPTEAAIQYHLGLVAQKQGRSVEATTAFKRTLLLNPNFDEAATVQKLIQQLGG